MKYALIAFALFATGLAPVRAEILQLRDGSKIDGKITQIDGTEVTLRRSNGVQVYDLNEFSDATRTQRFASVIAALEAARHAAVSNQLAREEFLRGVPPEAGPKNWFQSVWEQIPPARHKLLFAGLGLWALGWIWLAGLGYVESTGWGLLILIGNLIGGALFATRFPHRAALPLVAGLVGAGITLFILFL